MENEILQETETDLLETEEIQQTDVPIDENSTVSDVGTSETSGVDDESVLDPEETMPEDSYTQEEMEQIMAALLNSQTEETEEEIRTVFNTPLEEYSVSEGLLLIILLLILSAFVNSVFKGSRFMSKLR